MQDSRTFDRTNQNAAFWQEQVCTSHCLSGANIISVSTQYGFAQAETQSVLASMRNIGATVAFYRTLIKATRTRAATGRHSLLAFPSVSYLLLFGICKIESLIISKPISQGKVLFRKNVTKHAEARCNVAN